MAIVKRIRDNSGSGKEFETVTTSEVTYDTTPQVGSFNPVVSDGIAKALEVATEIPVVTSETAGKVLTASWDAETSTGSTSWGEAPSGAAVIEFSSSHTYTSEECAALVSQVSAALTARKPVFVCDVSGSMYPPRYALLSFSHWGPSTSTEYVFVAPTTSATVNASIDGYQNSNPNGAIYRLTNSSFTRESANVRSLPTTNSGTLGKVLGVTDSNGTLGWVTSQNLREGDAISIEGGLVSVNHDGTLATEGGITSLAGDDGVSFNQAMHYYSFTLTSEEADALNAEISANGSVTVGLHFATSPVLSMRSDSQCYLHVYGGPSIGGVSGVSALIGRSDAMGVLTADLSHVTVGSFTGALSAGVFQVWISDSSAAPEPYGANMCEFTSDGRTPIAADISVGTYSSELSVANPVPSYTTSEDGKVLGVVDNSGTAELQWVSAGTTYASGSAASVTLSADDTVVTNSVDVTSIVVGAGVKSAVVQWKVNSTTTLPTVTSGGSPLGASVNNPASLTVGHVVQVSILNGTWVCAEFTDPANPPVLPSHTIRCKFSSGYTPAMGDAQTLVDSQENIWDIYKSSNDWNSLFQGDTDLLEVVAANTTGVTDMSYMFYECSNLTSVPLFDTSSVTTMYAMFLKCTSLASVPLFDTSSVTNMDSMFPLCTSLASIPLFDTSSVESMNYTFKGCTSVESGALALYQQASTQANPPQEYEECFTNCGSNTVTGAAELAQIPASWGGTGA